MTESNEEQPAKKIILDKIVVSQNGFPEAINSPQTRTKYAINDIQIAFDSLDVLSKALKVETNNNLGYEVMIGEICKYIESAKEHLKQNQDESNKTVAVINYFDYQALKQQIESLAADLPYNQKVQRTLRTMQSIDFKANI